MEPTQYTARLMPERYAARSKVKMPCHGNTLTRLAREFVVRDIMILVGDLVCASGTPEAVELLDRYPDFDMIPLVAQDSLTAYLERGGSGPRPLRMSDLVSDATSILAIVDILTDRPRVFVLVRNRIGGYVHFSDLNRPIVKLPFLVLLEAVERRFFAMLSGEITPQLIETVLSRNRRANLETRMRHQQASGSNLNWAALLGFKELLLCAREPEL
jgi:hypothetical protein